MKNPLHFLLPSILFYFLAFSAFGQNPDVDCPAPPTFLVGDYQIADVNATIGPNNNSENFQAGTYTITGNGNTRTFQNLVFPGINATVYDVNMILNCGVIQIENLDPNLSCNGVNAYIFATTDIANSTPYSLAGSDTSFVINYIEDPFNSCGGPYSSSFSINKVCSQPQNISFVNVTPTSVDLNWLDTNNTSSSTNVYNLEYGIEGFALGTGTTINGISGNSVTAGSISPNVMYDFYITGACSDGSFSSISGPFKFINNVNPDFILDSNGVTCLCTNANFGDVGTLNINGEAKTFTKRTEQELRNLVLADPNDPQIALTCTSDITDMSSMFDSFVVGNIFGFNQNLENWDVSNVTTMEFMFQGASSFNQPIGVWNVSNVTNMSRMFSQAAAFNQPIGNWDVSNVTDMSFMFIFSSNFDQPLNNWNVANVTNMAQMLAGTNFNQPLDNWNVSNVTDINALFALTPFNQPINNWDVSNVVNMSILFSDNSVYDQPLNNWNVSNATSMSSMFRNATSFNQPLDTWNVSNVTSMFNMFQNANAFNQDISSWAFNTDVTLNSFLDSTAFDVANYESLLQSFDAQNLVDKTFGALNLTYCDTQFRDNLISSKNWLINGDFQGQCGAVFNPSSTPFVTNWTVDITDLSIEIFTINAYNYDFNINWGDGTSNSNVTTSINHTYAAPGTYTVSIQGVFPYFKTCEDASGLFVNCNNSLKLSSVQQWGDQEWQSMFGSFNSAGNLVFNTSQAPDVSRISNMDYSFSNCINLNQSINNWDVSNVQSMSFTFFGASQFDQPLSNWDVSNVINFEGMFRNAINFNQFIETWNISNAANLTSMFAGASSFNQPLDNWNVSNVNSMAQMFNGAIAFNQPLNSWDVSNLTNMDNMFRECTAFNQPLDNWNVSNVTNMRSLFFNATSFNQPLNMWSTSNVEFFNFMFFGASAFNQNINSWDLSSVVFINSIFEGASAFNQPLDGWDTSFVTNMQSMFRNATAFNQPLGDWDTSNVLVMDNMFTDAINFDQDISTWCVEQIPSEPLEFSLNSALQNSFKPLWGVTCNLGIEEQSLTGFTIYPNPVISDLNFSWNNNYNESLTISIYDIHGKMIYNKAFNQQPDRIMLSDLPSGIYILKLVSGNSSFTKKLIKN